MRFAPSPTGRFHLGNLRTAWISHEWARRLKIPWVLRFEDIDTPRVLSGAREEQLADMAAFGLKTEFVLLQSEFRERHWDLFTRAVESGAIYPCDCSRKDVQQALAGLASAPHDAQFPVYSGACRSVSAQRELPEVDSIAWRFRLPEESGHGDFIIARSEPSLDERGLPPPESFVPSYHWACAIDDYDGDHEILVRAWDLASALPIQRAIQKWLSATEGEERRATVFHTALITQNDGHRLEKRTRGVTWPELASRGFTTQQLIEIFARSFAFEDEWLENKRASFGEPRPNLTLSELGIQLRT